MCMTVQEMNEAMQKVQEWKIVKKGTEDSIDELNMKVTEYLLETEECAAVDKKGNPIRRFTGTLFTATLSVQERETAVKEKVLEFLAIPEIRKAVEDNDIDTSVLFRTASARVLRIG